MVSRFAMQAVDPEQVKLLAQMSPTDPSLYEDQVSDFDAREKARQDEAQKMLMEALKKPQFFKVPFKEDQPNTSTPSEGVGDPGIMYRDSEFVDPQDRIEFYRRDPIMRL